MYKYFFGFILFYSIADFAYSQNYHIQESIYTSPGQILPGNYMRIELCDFIKTNTLNSANPYTYIKVINDSQGGIYHILYQTDFSGMVNYIGISNNLAEKFNCTPVSFFCTGLKKINQSLFDSMKTDAVIECILNHLNLCADK